ncbi:Uncharacterised protein [BD1-7 clade bacterium]|uniref:DUF4823 domain-containing protein n=1 Tax=BD1-7 clade bacterium TaxID=2029982 RepID=A0A5S9R0P1_9GAMM|nr:Uncharacterised protein [BD1-7 clade bacterium]
MQTLSNKLITVIALLMLSGCSSTIYKYADTQALSSPLVRNHGVLITIPADGQFKDIVYEDSGLVTAEMLRKAFLQFSPRVDIAANCESTGCMEYLSGKHYRYLVVPEVVNWENRIFEWSTSPDRVKIMVTTYDVLTGEKISNGIFYGKFSSVFPLITSPFNNHKPHELLETPSAVYVSKLYR